MAQNSEGWARLAETSTETAAPDFVEFEVWAFLLLAGLGLLILLGGTVGGWGLTTKTGKLMADGQIFSTASALDRVTSALARHHLNIRSLPQPKGVVVISKALS